MSKRPTPAQAAGNERDAAINSILIYLDACSGCEVKIRSKHSTFKSRIPERVTSGEFSLSCRDDVLTVLREAGQRLTTSQILTNLSNRNASDCNRWMWGERTVKGVLAELVDGGEIDNDATASPRGYAASPVQ